MEARQSGQSQEIDGAKAMINIDVLVAEMPGLDRRDLERWISNDWVRADPKDGTLIFGEIDVFRVRLIRELRDDMDINEAALPIVLSLLDQVYDLRRRMRELSGAIGETVPEDVQRTLLKRLAR